MPDITQLVVDRDQVALAIDLHGRRRTDAFGDNCVDAGGDVDRDELVRPEQRRVEAPVGSEIETVQAPLAFADQACGLRAKRIDFPQLIVGRARLREEQAAILGEGDRIGARRVGDEDLMCAVGPEAVNAADGGPSDDPRRRRALRADGDVVALAVRRAVRDVNATGGRIDLVERLAEEARAVQSAFCVERQSLHAVHDRTGHKRGDLNLGRGLVAGLKNRCGRQHDCTGEGGQAHEFLS